MSPEAARLLGSAVTYPTGEWLVCPKCRGPVVRHLFWSQANERLFSYHCEQDGDVVPVIKDQHDQD